MDSFDRLQELSVKALFCSDLECVKTRLLYASWIYLAVVWIQSLAFPAPYGKFVQSEQTPGVLKLFLGLKLPARLGWCLQEVPAFLMAFLAILKGMDRGEKEHVLLLVPFTVHYFNRSFIFPLTIKEGTGLIGRRRTEECFLE